MTGADKRVFPRFACELTVELETRSGSVYPGLSRNLSRGGICLETVDALANGEEVIVRVTLVFDDQRTSEPLELPARVAWCTPLSDSHQVGIQFRPLSQDHARYLDMFLVYLARQLSNGSDDEGDTDDDPFTA